MLSTVTNTSKINNRLNDWTNPYIKQHRCRFYLLFLMNSLPNTKISPVVVESTAVTPLNNQPHSIKADNNKDSIQYSSAFHSANGTNRYFTAFISEFGQYTPPHPPKKKDYTSYLKWYWIEHNSWNTQSAPAWLILWEEKRKNSLLELRFKSR